MPSSRASTPESDDEFRKTLDAMAQSSPVAPPQGLAKRNHRTMTQDDGSSDNENNNMSGETEQTPADTRPVVLPNQNIIAVAQRCASRKRLCVDQVAMVESFAKDNVAVREIKIFCHLVALENKVDKLVTAKAAYQVSPDLNKNILNYAPAILLSSKIMVYKGQATTDVLLAILKTLRFDLPAGIENVPADWAKVSDVVKEALTQKRSKIKRKASSLKIQKTDKVHAPADQHQNIFNPTSAIVKGTKCSVNVVLCARVVLMRSVYLKHPGTNFWDKIDDRLAKIRKQAKGDASKIVKAFRQLLKADRKTHGVDDYELDEEAVDDFQQQVDDVIDMDAAMSVVSGQGNAAASNDGE
ncbi:hypothetical protein B0H17DRAFT_1203820 [Mycena rosella]|uniref:Uncharacterized protein n=1 Tax=Mycena rosella TaxID=1033263 RepID=A0AAD7DCF1_MYCRO|nr:hypothetical protein B0H17DRAFT_1203820 [Mycena rosella]